MGEVKKYKANLLYKKNYELAESPFYNEKTDLLSFVDINGKTAYVMKEGSEPEGVNLGQMIGSMVPAKDDSYLLVATDGLYILKDKVVTKLKDLSNIYEPFHRSNDAKADPVGRLFFGSTYYGKESKYHGNLYCYDNGNVKVLQKDTKISNGMAWSFDNKKFFFSDSMEHAVFEYDYDVETGDISNRKVLFEVTDGVPDGMTIDSDGNLWVAVWGGSRVECHSSATGELLAVIEVPAKQPSSICFLGETDRVFITSAYENIEGEYEGCLYMCRVDAKGVKNNIFSRF